MLINRYFVRKRIEMPDIKVELHQMIDQIGDDKVLEAVYTLLSNQAVAYTTGGTPLNQTAYEAMIDEGEEDINKGSVLSHEEVKAHFKRKMNG
ncbi:MAG: hypothetical protein JXQ90_04680 [Cyclobacteriaceae bacterium]